MLTEIRIIKDEGNHTTMNGLPFLTDAELGSPQVLDPVTITHVLPKTYPTGTLTFEHTFPETGKFIGIVTVKNARGQTYVSQFPFSVGVGFGKSIGIYAAMVVVLGAGVFLIWHLGRKKKLVRRKSRRERVRMVHGWPVFAEIAPKAAAVNLGFRSSGRSRPARGVIRPAHVASSGLITVYKHQGCGGAVDFTIKARFLPL